ncbi:hypothetical protein PPERSA_03722 [Pseudocohnilembus persalinus]|uniref:Uncharacterized protein n=1 Tax=Pseudocohnilembus persalinus TaxID=266149 RepID=A0A0V0QHI9_PSEPJ|nr:hypothetical protein PPERSA_03722 [Pseudocohnilembus persalinus]|eukprot:KRX01638.1 hypothetical protein PPERSA_03722 [Pseudocohnilembus persalinus]
MQNQQRFEFQNQNQNSNLNSNYLPYKQMESSFSLENNTSNQFQNEKKLTLSQSVQNDLSYNQLHEIQQQNFLQMRNSFQRDYINLPFSQSFQSTQNSNLNINNINEQKNNTDQCQRNQQKQAQFHQQQYKQIQCNQQETSNNNHFSQLFQQEIQQFELHKKSSQLNKDFENTNTVQQQQQIQMPKQNQQININSQQFAPILNSSNQQQEQINYNIQQKQDNLDNLRYHKYINNIEHENENKSNQNTQNQFKTKHNTNKMNCQTQNNQIKIKKEDQSQEFHSQEQKYPKKQKYKKKQKSQNSLPKIKFEQKSHSCTKNQTNLERKKIKKQKLSKKKIIQKLNAPLLNQYSSASLPSQTFSLNQLQSLQYQQQVIQDTQSNVEKGELMKVKKNIWKNFSRLILSYINENSQQLKNALNKQFSEKETNEFFTSFKYSIKKLKISNKIQFLKLFFPAEKQLNQKSNHHSIVNKKFLRIISYHFIKSELLQSCLGHSRIQNWPIFFSQRHEILNILKMYVTYK